MRNYPNLCTINCAISSSFLRIWVDGNNKVYLIGLTDFKNCFFLTVITCFLGFFPIMRFFFLTVITCLRFKLDYIHTKICSPDHKILMCIIEQKQL